jgi:outer membrane protein TolC
VNVRRAQQMRMKDLCQINSTRFETGKIATLDLALATNAYELARSMLTQEIGLEIDSKQGRDTREIDALRADLLKTAKEEWDAHMQEFRAGVGDVFKLLSSSRRLLAAELKSAKPADVVKAYKANVDRLSGLEELFKKSQQAGQLSRSSLLEARYARLEAQLEYQERLKP